MSHKSSLQSNAQPLIIVAALVFVLAASSDAASLNIAPNPSFEVGQNEADGWKFAPGLAKLVAGRTGARAVEGASPKLAGVCSSRSFDLDPEQSYRLSGWIRAERGRGRIVVAACDAMDKPL